MRRYNACVTQAAEQVSDANSRRDPRFDRAVVLASPDHPEPSKLLHGLKTRRISASVAGSAYAAMLRMAEDAPGVLVVHEPASHVRLPRLLAAIAVYYPDTILWQYRESDGSGLTRLASQEVLAEITADATPAQSKPPPQAADEDSGPLLTSDELAMLLAPDEDEADDDVDQPDTAAQRANS